MGCGSLQGNQASGFTLYRRGAPDPPAGVSTPPPPTGPTRLRAGGCFRQIFGFSGIGTRETLGLLHRGRGCGLMAAQRKSEPGLMHKFTPPGPVAQGYIQSAAPVALIVGPIGGAKTTSSASKLMIETCRQHPSTKDGYRRAWNIAIRKTYIRMHKTLTPSLRKFFGSEMVWTGDKQGALDGLMRWTEGGEKYELRLSMMCFQDEDIESFVRGLEPTGFMLNEFDEMPFGTFSHLLGRCGRYALDEKPEGLGPALHTKILGDCNMPDFDSWVHDSYLKQPLEGVEVFVQPSGLSPQAENIQHLRKIHPNYYQNLADEYRREGRQDKIKRFIENKPGYTANGKLIYPQFNADRHISESEILPDRDRPLIIGIDQGGQAAAIICQANSSGQMIALKEVVLEPGAYLGGDDFGRLLAQLLLEEPYRRYVGPGGLILRTDPAAMQRHAGSKEDDPRSWYTDFLDGFLDETRLREDQINIDVAPTNSLQARHNAVGKLLSTSVDGQECFVANKTCRRLNRGFLGGYRRILIKGTNQFHKDPHKDHFADIHDALQYAALECLPQFALNRDAKGGSETLLARRFEPTLAPHLRSQSGNPEVIM